MPELSELATTLPFSREEVACRLLDSSLTDDDKDFLRSATVRKTARHFHFANSDRLRTLMKPGAAIPAASHQ